MKICDRRRFEFQKRTQLFMGVDNETLIGRLDAPPHHNLRFVSLNGMMRVTAPLKSRIRISPERKQAQPVA
jgi:hypothetical protein